MGKFGAELIASMQQAAAHAGGRKVSGVRVTTVKIPDVKAIRKALHMSQHRQRLKCWRAVVLVIRLFIALQCSAAAAGRRRF